jgi:hypothetical protein
MSKNRNQNVTLNYVDQFGRQIQQITRLGVIKGDLVLSGALSVSGSVVLSGGIGISGNSNLSGALSLSGNLTLEPNISVQGNSAYHLRAVNSHLILSSSAGSEIYASGTFAVSGTITAQSDISVYHNITFVNLKSSSAHLASTGRLILSSGFGSMIVASGNFIVAGDGKIGVGVDGPSYELDIAGAANPGIRISEAGSTTSYLEIKDTSANQCTVQKVASTGQVLMDISPIVSDAASDADIRFFRATNTAGLKGISLHNGDGSAAIDTFFGVDGQSSYIVSGNIGIGTVSPQTKLHVSGNAGALRLGGNDHVYMEFYPQGRTTRYGYFGFTSAGTELLDITNEASSGGHIRIDPGPSAFVGLGHAVTPQNMLHVAGTIRISNSDDNWTTAGWAKGVRFPSQGYAILWDDATTARGIGTTSNGLFYVIRSTSSGSGAAPTYDVVVGTDGDVSIGTGGTPARRLEVQVDEAAFVASFFNDGNATTRQGIMVKCGEDTPSGTNIFFEAQEGDGIATGRLQTTGAGTFALADVSDIRRKVNVQPTKVDGLKTINSLELIEFSRTKQSHIYPSASIGFSAQNCKDVFPDMVSTDPDGTMMTMKAELVPVLVKAIQELSRRLEALEAGSGE